MAENGQLPYFYGRSAHRINAKGQVAVPARFRAVLPEAAGALVLLRGEGECLYCYTHEQFRRIVEKVTGDVETGADADFLRGFFEQVHSADLDTQGRMVIPSELRAQAGIKGEEVVFIGHNDRVEIWDAAVHARMSESREPAYEEKRERLARRIFGP